MLDKRNGGVESVIAALILVVIVVTAFGIAYGAYSSWIGAQRQGSLPQMQERLSIEDVRFNSTTTAALFITNVGKVDLKVTSIEIDGTATQTNVTLMPGSSELVNATYPTEFIPGETYAFRVMTDRGTSAEASAKYTGASTSRLLLP